MKHSNFFITDENVSQYIHAIGLWLKKKVGKKGVVLGMSGGIDCAVVARLCQTAGVDCHLIMLPCGYAMVSDKSYDHAKELINQFEFRWHEWDITNTFNTLCYIPDGDERELSDKERLVYANTKARIRMTYLYQWAQLNGRLVIGTSNLSERYVGYCTKWGDMGSDLNPLGNLTKREVYILAKWLEVPDCIINKPPSAGLWVGQTDEEELGFTYEQLDDFIMNGSSGCQRVDDAILTRNEMAQHKIHPIPLFGPNGFEYEDYCKTNNGLLNP